MKALFIKDFYTARTRFLVAFIILCLALLIGYMLDRLYMFTVLGVAKVLMACSPNLLYCEKDKKNNWGSFLSTLPIKKYKIVNEKYILCIGLSIIMFAIHLLTIYLSYDRIIPNEDMDILYFVEDTMTAFFIFCSIMFVLLLAELTASSTLAKVIIVIIGGTILAGIYFYTISFGEGLFTISAGPLNLITPSTLLGSIVLMITIVITYVLSLCFIKRREFEG